MLKLKHAYTNCKKILLLDIQWHSKADKKDQNMLPQNTAHWCKDYFELKANKKQQAQEELSALPLAT